VCVCVCVSPALCGRLALSWAGSPLCDGSAQFEINSVLISSVSDQIHSVVCGTCFLVDQFCLEFDQNLVCLLWLCCV